MKAQVISFRCVLTNKLGHFISASFSNEVINQAQEGATELRELVKGLQDVRPGDKRQIALSADQAYGFYDPELVQEVPRSELSRGFELEVGSEVRLFLLAKKQPRVFRVVSASADNVVLDGNHPLAGQDLIFDVEITAARELHHDDESLALGAIRHYH